MRITKSKGYMLKVTYNIKKANIEDENEKLR